MPLVNPRLLNLLVFLGCAGLLGFGLYLEHQLDQEPCPLCIVQRIEFILVALLALAAALHGPQRTGLRVYSALMLLFALAGVGSAGRQVWLQTLPPEELQACLPSLEYMMQALPFQEVIGMVLRGTADCAEVGWTFLGLSIPEWSLLAFLALALVALLQLLRRS